MTKPRKAETSDDPFKKRLERRRADRRKAERRRSDRGAPDRRKGDRRRTGGEPGARTA